MCRGGPEVLALPFSLRPGLACFGGTFWAYRKLLELSDTSSADSHYFTTPYQGDFKILESVTCDA